MVLDQDSGTGWDTSELPCFLIVPGRGLCSDLGCFLVVFFHGFQPFWIESCWMGGDSGSERMSEDNFCRRFSSWSWSIPEFKEAFKKLVVHEAAGLLDESFELLYRCFCQAVGLWVGWLRETMPDTPFVQELLGLICRELESTVGEDSCGNPEPGEVLLECMDGCLCRLVPKEEYFWPAGVPVREGKKVFSVCLEKVSCNVLKYSSWRRVGMSTPTA